MLGCGEYNVLITERGGVNTLAEIPWLGIFFGRVLDDASNGTVQIPVSALKRDESCCYALSELRPWKHEINIYRNGKLTWVGPVYTIQYSNDNITINTRDIFTWFDHRILPFDRGMYADLADIWNQYAADALFYENSMGIEVNAFQTGIKGQRIIHADDQFIAGDKLRELCRTGMDFTTVGRTIYTGGLEINFPEELLLWGPSCRTVSGTMRGEEMATEVFVSGAPPGSSEPIHAKAGGIDPNYGLIQFSYSEGSIEDGGSAQAAADNRLAFTGTPPLYLSLSLDPSAPFELDDLIPGRHCDTRLELNCLDVVDTMRLQSVSVSAVATNAGGVSESVNATVEPLGAE